MQPQGSISKVKLFSENTLEIFGININTIMLSKGKSFHGGGGACIADIN